MADDYLLTNLTLSQRDLFPGFDAALMVVNAQDNEYADPCSVDPNTLPLRSSFAPPLPDA